MITTTLKFETADLPAPVRETERVRALPLIWLTAAQAPFVFVYGWNLWSKPHFQFFPFAILAIVWLASARLRREAELTPGRSRTVLRMVFAALALQITAMLYHSYWLIGLSLLPAFVSFVYAVGSWAGVRRCWPSLALLGLCIPLPFALDWGLVYGLRDLTSTLGSNVLNLIRLPHLKNGNVLELGDRQLFVAEACSGVNSLFSTLCCVLVWAGACRMHWLETAALSLAAVFWLVAANTLRVVLVVVGVSWWGVDLTAGLAHEALGVATFALGLFLTWDTRQAMLFFFRPRQSRSNAAESVESHVSRALPWPLLPLSGIASWLVLGGTVLAAIGFVAAYRDDFASLDMKRQERALVERLGQLNRDDLPTEGQGWRIEEFKEQHREYSSAYGEYSRIWLGRIGPFKAQAAFDYPFFEWHDLTLCYRGQGWEIGKITEIPSPSDAGSTIKQVEMKRPGFQSGYLLFTLFRPDGTALAPPAAGAGRSWLRADSLLGLLAGLDSPNKEITANYQVQVLVVSSGEIDAEQRRAAADMFKAACKTARGGHEEGK